jgi:hypothetical protein
MVLNLTTQEKDYLLEVLEARHAEMLHELHHTDTADYRKLLRQNLELVEALKEKLKKADASDSESP